MFPGVPGFYDGTVRMIVTVTEINKPSRLVEVQSLDGLAWTALDTMQTTLGPAAFRITLTADGCFLFYVTAEPGTGGYRVKVIVRSADGVFRDAPITLFAASGAASNFPLGVAPMPRLDEIWVFDAMTNRAIRGTPQ